MKSCIFCNIVEQTIPASVVWEDQDSIAFLDINPVSSGHTLLIPKAHYNNLIESPDEVVKETFAKAKMLMPLIQRATQCDFVVLTVVGTDVPHFHIHLIPRTHGDGLQGFWPSTSYNEGEKELVLHAIRKETGYEPKS